MGKRPKHIPQRTCAGCKMVLQKRNLIRIVRTKQGVIIDPTGKAAGRGVYLHNQRSCWEQGVKGAVAHALKVQLTDDEQQLLQEYLSHLQDEELEPE